MTICVDFDGTLVEHEYPDVGQAVPGAVYFCREFVAAGAKLILWTMRSDGPTLTDAVNFCRDNAIELYAVNGNPDQASWSTSPKAYAHVYIDDAAACCPLRKNPRMGGRPFVDWDVVGPAVLKKLGK